MKFVTNIRLVSFFFVWVLYCFISTNGQNDSEIDVEVEDDLFIPTKEWQRVKEGFTTY